MSKKVQIAGKEFQVYDGIGLPKDGDVAVFIVPLKRQEQEYDVKNKDTGERTGEKAVVVKYADTGFGSKPAGNWDGTLIYNLEIKEAKNKQGLTTDVISL
jgi:uncharacterized membrane protein YkoI